MDPALATLVGVIVGATATGLTQWLFRRRDEARTVKVAARLLADALDNAKGKVDAYMRHLDEFMPDVNPGVDELWTEHRATLAGHLTLGEWLKLRDGVRAWLHFQGARKQGIRYAMAPIHEAEIQSARAVLDRLML